tara:strand:- start:98 stop:454 length:357 start_codon:yes stop_codon:yes gene_type:complete
MGSKVSAVQTGKDGVGQPKSLTGLSAIRLKAKEVQNTKNSTLKITGNKSAALWTIEVIVKAGDKVAQHYPPPVETPTPVAGFSHNVSGVGSNNNNNSNFNQQNPGFNAGSGPPNLSNL